MVCIKHLVHTRDICCQSNSSPKHYWMTEMTYNRSSTASRATSSGYCMICAEILYYAHQVLVASTAVIQSKWYERSWSPRLTIGVDVNISQQYYALSLERFSWLKYSKHAFYPTGASFFIFHSPYVHFPGEIGEEKMLLRLFISNLLNLYIKSKKLYLTELENNLLGLEKVASQN